ncbi:hypothetical protein HUB98_21930 [Paenibacillus barcinonensis]|uniref:Uncharacterized protein n=1 Tax=Paenibacillus barcinonensis TaxID=198119 RepID=A0A2V4V463_PAEBA|nr:hypothetical protein [Paenibacillus barcinonensis]PYE47217.1 hypothetical protein DFQ00_11566 [Paenibacillus barcinonensis]QKS58621.1 hypothetical protein HUB98_21930 [Paenibacillus barcinonensis]
MKLRRKILLLCTSVFLSLSLSSISYAMNESNWKGELSGFSYNSTDNVFSKSDDLNNIEVSISDSHLSVSYMLNNVAIDLQADKYSEDKLDSYSGTALVGENYLKTDIVTNEYGLSGVVFDSHQVVHHAFVIDNTGETVKNSQQIIDTINDGQGEMEILLEEQGGFSTFSTAKDLNVRLIHKSSEMGGFVRTGYNDGTLYYTRYTNDPDGIKIYFDKLNATIEKLGPFGSFGIKNVDSPYGFVYTTPFDVTQPFQDYPIKQPSTSSNKFILYSIASRVVQAGPVPIYAFDSKEITIP